MVLLRGRAAYIRHWREYSHQKKGVNQAGKILAPAGECGWNQRASPPLPTGIHCVVAKF